MLGFLLEEGVLSTGILSGVFTNTLLLSLKTNIIDPLAENVVPDHTLDRNGDGVVDEKDEQILQEQLKQNKQIKWQSFIKDLVVWIILMSVLYLIWTNLIKKINVPIKPHP
jgi:large-conductance mechanosensitive channel